MNELGTLLRKIRNEKKLSMITVCNATGITNSRLSRIERGKNKSAPPATDLAKLADLYNVDLKTLLPQSDTNPKEISDDNSLILKNIDLLSASELRHIQDEIDFILVQKGMNKNEL